MAVVAQSVGLDLAQLAFVFHGNPIRCDQTPEQLRMKDDDIIYSAIVRSQSTSIALQRAPDMQFLVMLQKKAREHHITVCSKNELLLTGSSENLNKAFSDILRLVKLSESQDELSLVRYPQEWQEQDQNTNLFVINRGSREWIHVTQKMGRLCWIAVSIQIYRIQNKWLWEKYAHHKMMMHKKNAGAVNEMELFHSNNYSYSAHLYDSEEGFDLRQASSGSWGQANYFVSDAEMAVSNCAQPGLKKLFMAKVLTGHTCHVVADTSLRMPVPRAGPLDENEINFAVPCHDTTTGWISRTKQVFMTYDNLKAYPTYLIQFYPCSHCIPAAHDPPR